MDWLGEEGEWLEEEGVRDEKDWLGEEGVREERDWLGEEGEGMGEEGEWLGKEGGDGESTGSVYSTQPLMAQSGRTLEEPWKNPVYFDQKGRWRLFCEI